jgi:hypothetical protein
MIKAAMKHGKEVYCELTENGNPYRGGYYVEVCWTELMDIFYNFCIHPDDCDCWNSAAVEEFVKKVVSGLDENDF